MCGNAKPNLIKRAQSYHRLYATSNPFGLSTQSNKITGDKIDAIIEDLNHTC
jgi:hypothetical protein